VGKQKNFPIICIGDDNTGQFLGIDELSSWDPKAVNTTPTQISNLSQSEKELHNTIQQELETARNFPSSSRSEFILKNLTQQKSPSEPSTQNPDENGWAVSPSTSLNSPNPQTPIKELSPTDRNISAAYNTMNVFGRAGASVETTLRGVYNWLGWPSVSPEKPVIHEEKIEVNSTEIVVIHTNWYYKQQVRILKFYFEEFVRIHPITKQVKATHKYSQVEKITIRGNTYFVLYFLPQLEIPPEYYEAKERDVIVELIIKRALTFKVRVTLIEVYDS